MAAGQGFKTFTTGEVLTAGDVNGYLMQGINVFANATARDAAITSPQEGQFAYTKDTNSLWYYTGSAWAASGATGDIEGVSVTSPITGGGTSGTVTIGIDSTAVVPSQTGNSGKYLTTNGTASSWATVSSGLTWTQRAIGIGGTITSIGYNGSNLYAAGTSLGELFTSPDGITWTSRTSPFGSNTVYKLAYGNGLWVAVADTGLLATSPDGITWTLRTANMSTNPIYDVTYANSLWVAVGEGGGTVNTGGVTYSTDGITWTRKSQSLTVGTSYNTVIWNGTNWIVGANASTNNFIYASTPSGTWTAANIIGAFEMAGLYYDGTRTIFQLGTTATSFYYSTSATLASATAYTTISTANNNGGASQTRGTAYYNSRIYQARAYVQSFNTVPTATSAPTDKTQLTIAPNIQFLNTSPYFTISNPCVFAGAAGIIIGGNTGQIWTSF